MKVALNSAMVKDCEAREKPFELNDLDVSGFLLRVQPTSRKSYVYSYRSPLDRKRKRITIGKHRLITQIEARNLAKKYAGQVAEGRCSESEKQQTKSEIDKASDAHNVS